MWRTLILLALLAPSCWGQASVTGNGQITIAPSGPAGMPAYALNGSGCPISNDETHTSDTVTSYSCPLPNPTISGNLLVVSLRYHTPAQTPTWTDNVGGNTYSLAVTCTDSTNATVGAIWYVQGVKAGVTVVTPHFGSAAQFVEAQPYEFTNAGALDNATCQAGSGTSVTVPALGTLTSGDLVFQFGAGDNDTQITGCTKGSQSSITWTLRSTMIADDFPSCVQYGVYGATTSFAPTFTVSNSISYVSAAAAFKAATTGAAPPAGIRAVYVQHDNTENETAASIPLQFPISGNALAIMYNSGCAGTSNTDCSYPTLFGDGTNSYQQVGGTIISNFGSDGGNSVGSAWYAHSVTAGTYLVTATMHTRSSGGNGNTFMVYDVSGANATPLDTSFGGAGLASVTFDQTSGGAGGPLTTWTATPSAANELVLALVGSAFDTWNSVTSPSGASFLSCNYITQTNPSHCDLNSGNALFNAPTTASQTWIWVHDASQDPGTGAGISLGIALHQ